MFCQPAQESRVVCLTRQPQLSSPSALPMQAAEPLQITAAVTATTIATTRRVSPSTRTRASSSATNTASTPITCTMSATLIHATKHANYNNKHKNTHTHSRDDTCTMHHARNNCWTSSKSSCLAELVTPSLVTKDNKHKQQQQKILFCWYSKNKEDACCSMLWPGHSNFKSSPKCKNNFGWLLMTRMPRLIARLANLA
jgi:hypothetical protein